ncbi:MAG: DUF3990 domain-containing protein [Deltaproteobacteria bacterium]|jgi:hypothetical protein|nr:DUF3990 domain-containing protein [Deltaproteobacteria bacterium]
MIDVVRLYQGTSYDFEVIELQQGRSYKDFGPGFYTSADIGQAKSMAEIEAKRRESKLKRICCGPKLIGKWLYRYQFDIDQAKALAVKEFSRADREWVRFITFSRSRPGLPHQYDMVIGPRANDDTNPTIKFNLSGGVGAVGSKAAIDELVRLLLPFQLQRQYFFATKRALDCLTLIKKERI